MYRQGDELKLANRPEWGVGTVQKVEFVPRDGRKDQRAWVRFPSVGVKTILAGAADAELVNRDGSLDDQEHTFAARELAHDSGWIGQIAKRQPEEAMTSLPPETNDPFAPVRVRLQRTFDLYRFNERGGSLVDWAVAQTGLDDPLARFNRNQLEEFFRQWSRGRDEQLRTLMQEARRNREPVDDLMKQADPTARHALQECQGRF